MTVLTDYERFVADEQASAAFSQWKKQNPGEWATWASFHQGVILGNRPKPAALKTAYGKGLVDAAVEYLDATAPAPPPPPPPPPPSGQGSVDGNPFAASAWPNRGFPTPVSFAPNDADMISDLCAKAYGGGWLNMNAWSVAEYRLKTATGQPTKTIALEIPYRGAGQVTVPWLNFQVPPDGGDQHVVIALEDTGKYWEFQGTNSPLQNGRAHSVAMGDMVAGDALPTATDRISGLTTPGGLVRPEHFSGKLGPIALRCAIPDESAAFEWPSIQSDGGGSGKIPSGAALYLDPSLDLTKFGLNQYQLVLARFWQARGMWVGDSNGGSNTVTLYAEATCDGSVYPFGSLSLPVALFQQAHVLSAQSAGVKHTAMLRKPEHLAGIVRVDPR